MTASERCEICDRPIVDAIDGDYTASQWVAHMGGIDAVGSRCYRPFSGNDACCAHAPDWRVRCLLAESERDAMRKVVEAAVRWITNTCVHDYDVDIRALEDAVTEYRRGAGKEK